MDDNNLRWRHLFPVAPDVDADRCLAYVQPMLRKSDLVPDALRAADDGSSRYYDRHIFVPGGHHQHPADADYRG
jgi:hypothetical protein